MFAAHHHFVQPGLTFAPLALMWLVMMTAMMAPTVWPWVRAFHRFGLGTQSSSHPGLATLAFIGGYVVSWAGYSIAAATVQNALGELRLLDEPRGRLAAWPAAAILAVAGVYQLTPFKRACLTHCRNPITYFLTRWRDGAAGGFRMGVAHGAFCVGCCWALMGTALAVGVMSPWWMAALTIAVLVEQVTPWGLWARMPIGLALLGGGLARL
jgi:predicted metal-binding membrane protein